MWCSSAQRRGPIAAEAKMGALGPLRCRQARPPRVLGNRWTGVMQGPVACLRCSLQVAVAHCGRRWLRYQALAPRSRGGAICSWPALDCQFGLMAERHCTVSAPTTVNASPVAPHPLHHVPLGGAAAAAGPSSQGHPHTLTTWRAAQPNGQAGSLSPNPSHQILKAPAHQTKMKMPQLPVSHHHHPALSPSPRA